MVVFRSSCPIASFTVAGFFVCTIVTVPEGLFLSSLDVVVIDLLDSLTDDRAQRLSVWKTQQRFAIPLKSLPVILFLQRAKALRNQFGLHCCKTLAREYAFTHKLI